VSTQTAATGPRILLRRLRELMAAPAALQLRLDRIVKIIASNMVAEVCSIYLARAGDMLELFATEGLNPEAIHQTRLRFGEGLVGRIAALATPVSLSEAQKDPFFAYRPETGEEIYHSFLGVPIIRSNRVVGVVVVQNKAQRRYTEEEIEALQIVTMALAELVGSGNLVDPHELTEGPFVRGAPHFLEGLSLAEGIAEGVAVFHEAKVQITKFIAENPDDEKERLSRALADLRQSIDDMLASAELKRGGEHRDILEAYRMFAHDRGWLQRIETVIESGLTAEAAVERVQLDNQARMAHVTDPYISERLSDLDDLAHRLIRHLVGLPSTAARGNLPENTVLIAKSMGPAELLDYDRQNLRAVVLAEGAPSAHVSIVARALEIPMVGKLGEDMNQIQPGDELIVDADNGQVHVNPGADIAQSYHETMAARAQRAAEYAAHKDLPAVTVDGAHVQLSINAGLTVDLPHLEETGADGIGLFRTEFQFLVGSTLPRLQDQAALYREVLAAAKGKPVVFRTLDIGGDKEVRFIASTGREENPALGWRAIRVALDRPALLRYQVRALIQAAVGAELRVMFPMIADVSEFKTARGVVDREVDRLTRMGSPMPEKILVGTMLEVPSLAWQLDTLLPLADFVSIGSSDLLQFFFAFDRNNPALAGRYDVFAPSALGFIKSIIDKCHQYETPVSLCGEMAGSPLVAMALVGLGLRSLSVPASAVGPIKTTIRSLDVGALEDYLGTLFGSADHSVQGKLREFAQDHRVVL